MSETHQIKQIADPHPGGQQCGARPLYAACGRCGRTWALPDREIHNAAGRQSLRQQWEWLQLQPCPGTSGPQESDHRRLGAESDREER